MIDALLFAVRDKLRAAGISLGVAECEIMDDGKPPPRAGNSFAAVHDGVARSTNDNTLYELYDFSVTLTMRLGSVSIDRVGDQLIARNLTRDPVGNRQGFNAKVEQLRSILHMNWGITVLTSQTPASANDNLSNWSTGTVYGFCEPARYRGYDRVQLVGSEWFSTEVESEGEGVVEEFGIKSRLRFEGAKRFQSIPADTPLNLTITGSSTIQLSWSASAGAVTYRVYRGTSSGGETLLANGVAATSYEDATGVAGTTYYYYVTAVGTSGESSRSNEVSARIFTPTDISGLTIWFKRDTGFYQDTAGTTPAVSAGDGDRRWSDASGNGFHATQSVAGNKAHLNTHAWDQKALWLKGITNYLTWSGSSIQQNNISVYVRFQMQDTCQTGHIVQIGDGNTHELSIYSNSNRLFINTETINDTGMMLPVDTDCSVALLCGSGSADVTLNGTSVAVTGQAAIALSGGCLGSRLASGGVNFPNALILEVLVYVGKHNATQKAQVLDYINTPDFTQRFSVDLPLIIFDGNSIVSGSGASSPQNAFVYKTMAGLTTPVQYANLGIVGQCVKQYSGLTSAQMAENRATKVDAYFDSDRTYNFLVMLEFINSEAHTATGAILKSDHQTYMQGAKTANPFIKIIVYNDAPEGHAPVGSDCNALVDADFPTTTADTFVHSASVSYADKEILVKQMALTRPDTTHPGDPGHLTMSVSNLAAINQLGVT